jgi:hypothetical protein
MSLDLATGFPSRERPASPTLGAATHAVETPPNLRNPQ